MNTESFKQLDILEGGLRISGNSRNISGGMRYNKENNKFEVFTGEQKNVINPDGKKWENITQEIASENNLGSIKLGSNLFVNSSTGIANSISVGTSMFYQHIVTVSKYNIPFDQHINTNLPKGKEVSQNTLPDGSIIKGGSGDFTSIQEAITFIESLNNDEYPRNSENQWLIYISPGTYKENITLSPYISLKGCGKSVTILEPTENSDSYIKLTCNTSIFDLSINCNTGLINNLINLDTYLGREKLSSSNHYNNTALIKNVDFNLFVTGPLICVNIESGNLQFEDSFILFDEDISENPINNSNEIIGFKSSPKTHLNINEGKFNFIINTNNFNFYKGIDSNLTMVNSFVDIKDNLVNINYVHNEEVDKMEVYNTTIINSLNSDCQIRNCQLLNYTYDGSVFKLEDSSNNYNILEETDYDSISINEKGNILSIKYNHNENDLFQKIEGKKGIKINQKNYKIVHINKTDSCYEITLNEITLNEITLNEVGDTNTIIMLNLNSIANSYLRANKYIINCNSSKFLIENNDVSKEQGNYNIKGESLVEFNDFNIIHVSKDKGDFNSISQAIQSLGKLDTNLKYLIRVHTGKYNEKNIDLTGKPNLSIIGDSWENTELVFSDLTEGNFITGDSGLIENLKIKYYGSTHNKEVSIIKFGYGVNVKLNYIKFDVETNNINIINLESCDKINLSNLDLDIKYDFKDNTNLINGIKSIYESEIDSNVIDSNVIELNNVKIHIKKNTTSKTNTLSFNEDKSPINNLSLMNGQINATNLDLELTTEISNCNLIKSEGSTKYNQIYGNRLIINNPKPNNFIINNESNNSFIIINSNLLGVMSGDNIFTPGCVNKIDNTFYSFHNSLLSNKQDSILIGNNAGMNTSANSKNNILIGKDSGKQINDGVENIFIGNNSGEESIGSYNLFMGHNAGKNLKDVDNRIIIGHMGEESYETGGDVLIGNNAGPSQSGNQNTLIGFKSGMNTGSQNCYLGYKSGINSQGEKNTIMGFESGMKAGSQNCYFGYKSGIDSGGEQNTIMGFESGTNINDNNVVIGASSLTATSLVDIKNNVVVGSNSGKAIKNSGNVYIGHKAGEFNEGTDNIIIGECAQSFDNNNTNETKMNVIIGKGAAQNMITNDNVIIGYNAGGENTIGGAKNILIGKESGIGMDGGENIFIGNNSGKESTGSNNLFMGHNAGKNSNIDDSNIENNRIIIGHMGEEIKENETGCDVLIGNNAGSSQYGIKNTLIGFKSGMKAGSQNCYFGYKSGIDSTGGQNTIMGFESGMNAGSKNCYIGWRVGQKLEGDNNTIIGFDCVGDTTPSYGNNNTIIGNKSAIKMKDAENNTIIGNSVCTNLCSTNNTIIGNRAAENSEKISHNILIGDNTCSELKGNNNIILGNKSGKHLKDTNDENKNENNNIIIGHNTNYTGGNSIIIGNGIDNEIDNSLLIGNKKKTIVRQMTDDNNEFIPVENAQIFGSNKLLKVYQANETASDTESKKTYNYLNTHKTIKKPHKSIIHTFPEEECSIVADGVDEVGANIYYLKGKNSQLENIDFFGTESSSYITIKHTDELEAIYKIYKIEIENKIKIESIKGKSIPIPINLFSVLEINNNILNFKNYGRYDAANKNIYSKFDSIQIIGGMYIEEVISAEITLQDGTTNGTLIVSSNDNIKKIFKIGDKIKLRNKLNNNNNDYIDDLTIMDITGENNTYNIKIKEGNEKFPDLVGEEDENLRLILCENNYNPILGNFNNNKVVINGDEELLEDTKTTLTVKGSLGLTDFLLLEVSKEPTLELEQEEAIIWLEENDNNIPELKIKFKSIKYKIKLEEETTGGGCGGDGDGDGATGNGCGDFGSGIGSDIGSGIGSGGDVAAFF